jgi:chemotaxis protein CheC
MSTAITLSRGEMARLQELAGAAVGNVSRGLTEMFSADVVLTAMQILAVPLSEVGGLLGDPEMEVAAIYLIAEGDIRGHLLLLMQIGTAMELCDILLEQPQGTTTELGEMEVSALGEVGNIVGSFFLNSIADDEGLRLQVTPPGVFCDMAGAAINVALLEVAMYADEALVIDANFEHRGRHLPAWFLAFPEPNQLRTLLAARGAA